MPSIPSFYWYRYIWLLAKDPVMFIHRQSINAQLTLDAVGLTKCALDTLDRWSLVLHSCKIASGSISCEDREGHAQVLQCTHLGQVCRRSPTAYVQSGTACVYTLSTIQYCTHLLLWKAYIRICLQANIWHTPMCACTYVCVCVKYAFVLSIYTYIYICTYLQSIHKPRQYIKNHTHATWRLAQPSPQIA